METKRCIYCNTLSRMDADVCSRCERPFVTHGLNNGQEELRPPASPHRVGHYSGIHPEDQPYLSIKKPPYTLSTSPVQELSPAPELQQEQENTTLNGNVTIPMLEGVQAVVGNDMSTKVDYTLPLDDPPQSKPQPSMPKNVVLRKESRNQRQKPWLYGRVKTLLIAISVVLLIVSLTLLSYLAISYRLGSFVPFGGKNQNIVPKNTQEGLPLLHTSVTTLDLGADVPGAVSQGEILLVNAGEGSLTWQPKIAYSNVSNIPTQSWLKVTPFTPATNTFADKAVVTIAGDRTGLRAQDAAYSGDIMFTQAGNKSGKKAVVSVNMMVTNQPTGLSISPTSLVFSGTPDKLPASQMLTLTNKSKQPLHWIATVHTDDNIAWFTLPPNSGDLEPGAKTQITESVQPEAVGTHQGRMTFTYPTGSGQSREVSVGVTFVVDKTPPPAFQLQVVPDPVQISNPNQLDFAWNAADSKTAPLSRSFVVNIMNNTTNANLSWQVQIPDIDGAHATASPLQGIGSGQTVTVNVDMTKYNGLSPVHQVKEVKTTITVSSSDATVVVQKGSLTLDIHVLNDRNFQ